MKKKLQILTANGVSSLLFMLVVFCGCGRELAEEAINDDIAEPRLVLQMSQNNEITDSKNTFSIRRFSSYLFHEDKLIKVNTSTYDASNLGNLSISLPQGYTGKKLKAMVVLNDTLAAVSDGMTLEEFTQSAVTRLSPANFEKEGFPMSGEVEFEVQPAIKEKLLLKNVCSAIYVKLAEQGDGADLSDFMFTVMSVQQKGGFLFQDGAIAGATQDVIFNWGTLKGAESQPLCYFYPTNEDLFVRITPHNVKYLGVNSLLMKLPREKALLKNQKYLLTVNPPTAFSHFRVTLRPWSEEELNVDVAGANKTELEDLNVNIGSQVVQMKEESQKVYVLNANGKSIQHLNFSLPKGAFITPNPSVLIGGGYKEQQFEVISESGESRSTFTVKYYPDKTYTLVVLGDTEYGFRSYSYDQATRDVNKIAAVKRGNHYFKEHPSFKIDPELLMVVGDVSGDRDNDPSRFLTVFNECYNAGIKCMNIYGNHDWDPVYWEFSNGTPDPNDPGFTLDGRKSMEQTRERIQRAADRSGISITIFKTSIGETPMPYYFTYRGVRYFCGNVFWFMPSFIKPTFFWQTATLANTDNIIVKQALEEDLLDKEGMNYPAIWMHHYPFNCGDKWWSGYITYPGWFNGADERRNKMKELIGKTKNPTAFAGHVHSPSVDRYIDPKSGKRFTEYVTPYFRNNGGSGYFVLVSEKEGVLAAQEFNFNNFN